MSAIIAYRGNEPYIFVSYSHRDSDSVRDIIERMQIDTYRVWFDDGIDPGTEWDENIAQHIEGCGYFIAFISNNYLGSENCKDELNYARDLGKKRLLVYLEQVKLPSGMAMRMNRMQYISKYVYPSEDAFFSVLYSSDGISSFKSGYFKNDVKSADTVRNYFDDDNNVSDNRERDNVEKNIKSVPENRAKKTNSQSADSGKKAPSSQKKAEGVTVEKKKVKYSNGDEYEGDFVDGIRCGYGVYRYASGNYYEGEWENDKFSGHGVYHFVSSGERYEGEWKAGQYSGYGEFYFKSGTVYKGYWSKDKKNGKGVMLFASGERYEGIFKDDKYSGHGVMSFPTGTYYDGEFEDDKYCGHGKFRYTNAEYDGEWRDNQRHGQGILKFDNGEYYKGAWQNDAYCGYGEFRYESGSIYRGEWRDNRTDGQGYFVYYNGDEYRGSFKDGAKDGYGVYRFSSGSVYEGEWKNDQYHGKGTLRTKDKTYTGTWKNGEFVS